MAARNLVVIGASAGGLPAVATILSGLPTTLPAAVVIVVHTRSRAEVLPRLLARRSGFAVELAFDQAEIRPGVAYVAPADRHVVVTPRALRVVQGPRENGFRPAIDPLFRTAARARGAAVIGVILSGALDDGSFGLHAIVQHGGAAIVQDPDDAEMSSMPLAALRQTRVDAVLPAAQIADAIRRMCEDPAEDAVTPTPAQRQPEPQGPSADISVEHMEALNGSPTPITCPACGGALWETRDGSAVHYACHVGHQYAPDSLLADHRESVEQALWTAVRVLEQHAELRKRMSARADSAGMPLMAESFAEDSRDYHAQADIIRRLVFGDVAAPAAEARPTRRRKARAR